VHLLCTSSLAPVLAELRAILGESPAAQQVYARVERAYTQSATLAEATQAMLHDLFGHYGLLVLNMNDARLKRHFVPVMQDEVLHQTSQRLVSATIGELQQAGFKTQAAPRDINLFYLLPGSRERIAAATLPDGSAGYQVLNSERTFSRTEMLEEMASQAERFSPNVVLRPLYQEMLLPNLAYVGGGGELAYWLERKAQFEHYGVPFPMLVRRNSALWVDRETGKKLGRLGFGAAQFFGETESLVRDFVSRHAAGEVSLSPEIGDLKRLYEALAHKATAIDPTLEKALRAEEVKAVAGLEQWQSRLVRAEKQKHEVALNQLRALKEKLFPANGLQERTDNFMPYLVKYGDAFVAELKAAFQPLEPGFLILEEE
ncbi:MAG TPA: bacillithiol biosynthesis cysteine-adding enzyme BshC, partial [Saprospiraceae bacterium]|nr:bacillithiol biosynthesis cysteine-adding enzyme BshC [Saprospiraceae bacterium]